MAGACWLDTGLVFTTKSGAPVDPRNATRHFHRMLREASLSVVRFHDMRHTAATLLHAQGVDARFTRLTNAFSKKWENHAAMVTLYFMYYNFARIHQNASRNASDGSRHRGSRLVN